MSISVQTDKIFGTGNGSTTLFSFPFKIFSATDLVVYTIDTTQTPNVTHGPLILNTDYTVSINTVGEGGSVTFIVAPTTAWQTLIQRVEPFTQSLVLNTEGNLPASQIENQLDLMTMLCIQVNEFISRCPQLPITYGGTLPLVMPLPQAGLVLAWDPTASFLVNVVATTTGNIALPISNGNITALTAPNKVSGAALFSLSSTPSGAGIFPIANMPTGTTSGKLPVLDSNGKVAIGQLNAFPIIIYSDQKTASTGGGAATTGSWQTRTLNTKEIDTTSISSLSSNQVTLPAGTYKVRAYVPFYLNVGDSNTRLFNVTASAVLLLGTSLTNAANVTSPSFIDGVFTIGVSSAIAVQYQVTTNNGGNDLGYPGGFQTEVYTRIMFEKIG